MSTTAVRAALETRLKTWADAQSPKIPIAFQNVTFNKPTSGTYLEAILIPNYTFNREVSGQHHTDLGMFQVNCWSKVGEGMGKAELLAQQVRDLYPLIPKNMSVSIEQTPSIDNPIQDPSGWVAVPVLIKYRFEA